MAVIDDKFTGESSLVDLDAHVPDTTGTGWTVLDQTGNRDFRIPAADDDLRGEAENSDRTLYTAQGTYPSNEYDVEALVRESDTVDDLAWLIGRATNSSNYYCAGFVAGINFFLVKKVADVVTTLTSGSEAAGLTNKTVKFEIRDATKKFYIDNVEKLSDPDNVLTDIGEAGVGMGNVRLSTDDLGGLWKLDDFLVTDAAAAADLPSLVMAPYIPG